MATAFRLSLTALEGAAVLRGCRARKRLPTTLRRPRTRRFARARRARRLLGAASSLAVRPRPAHRVAAVPWASHEIGPLTPGLGRATGRGHLEMPHGPRTPPVTRVLHRVVSHRQSLRRHLTFNEGMAGDRRTLLALHQTLSPRRSRCAGNGDRDAPQQAITMAWKQRSRGSGVRIAALGPTTRSVL